jgi:hypothetical protein
MQHGRRGESLVGDKIANLALPKNLPVEVEGGGVDSAAVQEVDEEPAAIAAHGGGGSRGISVLARIRLTSMHLGLPDLFSRASVQAEHGLGLLAAIGCGQIKAIAHDRG